MLRHLSSLLTNCLITLIVGLRPLLGPAACKYDIGCTQFAVIQLQTMPFAQAVVHIIKRVISCNPLY